MNKKVILVDMDDTIEKLLDAWIDRVNQKFGTNAKSSDVKEWNVGAVFPTLTHDEVYDVLTEADLYQNVKPIDGAAEYLKRLMDDGHDIYIVTSTHYKAVQPKLDDVLFKYFPFISRRKVIIANNKQMIKGDILVDDGVHNHHGGEYQGILFTASHNEDYDAEGNGLYRANTWKEVYEIIQKIIEEDSMIQ